MKQVVFDTNVWISAIAFHGRVRRLRDEAVHERIRVAVSPAILEETIRILSGPKFRYSPDEVAVIELEIRELARMVRPSEHLEAVKADPDDDRVLECAVESGSEIIVSGDSHLLDLGTFRGIRIMGPAAFLGELETGKGTDPGKGPGVEESPAAYGAGGKKAKGSPAKRVKAR